MLKIEVKYHDENMPRLKKIGVGDWIDLVAVPEKNERGVNFIAVSRGDILKINLGVSIKLPLCFEAHLVVRSSTFDKYGLIQTNGFGVIDNSYCGDGDIWKLPVIATKEVLIPQYARIAQFRIVPSMTGVEIVEVESLQSENRGGFGSTGV